MKLKEGYVSNRDGVERSGQTVDNLLDKVEDLGMATYHEDGMMSFGDKLKLDSLEDDEELTIEEIEALLI